MKVTIDGVVIDKNYPAGILDTYQGKVSLNTKKLKKRGLTEKISA